MHYLFEELIELVRPAIQLALPFDEDTMQLALPLFERED